MDVQNVQIVKREEDQKLGLPGIQNMHNKASELPRNYRNTIAKKQREKKLKLDGFQLPQVGIYSANRWAAIQKMG